MDDALVNGSQNGDCQEVCQKYSVLGSSAICASHLRTIWDAEWVERAAVPGCGSATHSSKDMVHNVQETLCPLFNNRAQVTSYPQAWRSHMAMISTEAWVWGIHWFSLKNKRCELLIKDYNLCRVQNRGMDREMQSVNLSQQQGFSAWQLCEAWCSYTGSVHQGQWRQRTACHKRPEVKGWVGAQIIDPLGASWWEIQWSRGPSRHCYLVFTM